MYGLQPLKIVNFLLNSLFVRCQFKRSPVEFKGLPGFVQPSVDIAEVLGDSRIIRHKPVRLFKVCERFFIALHFVIYPAEAVQYVPVIRFDGKCFLDEDPGFAQVYAALGVQVTDKVECIGIIAVDGENLAHRGNTFIEHAGLFIEVPEIEEQVF